MLLFAKLADKNVLENAVAILFALGNYAIVHYSQTFLSLTVVGKAGRLMATLNFSSDEKIFKGVYPGFRLVDLVRLHNLIRTSRDTENIELLIREMDGEKDLLIRFRRTNNCTRSYVLAMHKIVGDHARVMEPEDGLGIGIKGEQFVQVFNQLAISEATDVCVPLRIYRTEDQLRISARGHEIVLRREDGLFRLLADREETTDDSYSLYHTGPIMHAARLSHMVWIYKEATETVLRCELKAENAKACLLFAMKERVIRMIAGRLGDVQLLKNAIEAIKMTNHQGVVTFSKKGLSIESGAGAMVAVESSIFKPGTFCCTLFGSKVEDLNSIYHQLNTIRAQSQFGLILFGTGWERQPSHAYAFGNECVAEVDSQELHNALNSLGIPRTTGGADYALHISMSKIQLSLRGLSDSELEQLTHSPSPGVETKTAVITEGNFFFASYPVGRQYEMVIRVQVNSLFKAISASTFVTLQICSALGVFLKCELPKISIIFPLRPIELKKLEGQGF